MKTLIINGSPRKNGDTAALIKMLTENISGKVTIIDTYSYNAAPCIDCRCCWHKPGCAVKDEMQLAYELINEADNIVLASPLFYSELSGSLLNFASRLQTFYAAKYIRKDGIHPPRGKRGVLLLVGGGGTKDVGKAEDTANMIFGLMGAKSVGTAASLNTDCYEGKQGVAPKDDVEVNARILRLSALL